MSYGSSNHVPARPFAADTSRRSGSATRKGPDVSIRPPLPKVAPPRARQRALCNCAARKIAEITPDHHRSTIPSTGGRGINKGALLHPGLGGLSNSRVTVLPAATDLHQAALAGASGQQLRTVTDPDQICL